MPTQVNMNIYFPPFYTSDTVTYFFYIIILVYKELPYSFLQLHLISPWYRQLLITKTVLLPGHTARLYFPAVRCGLVT